MKRITLILAAFLVCSNAFSEPRNSAKQKAAAEPKASTGSSAPTPETAPATSVDGIDLSEAFKKADIDGDGLVSKAEAAGNERLVVGFDRADRNHDGKLSRAEFDSVYKPRPPKPSKRAAAK